MPADLERYELSIPPYKMHDALAYASLFIGESGTMAGECAVLGTPCIYVNSLPLMGYLKEAEKNGLLFHLSSDNDIIKKIDQFLKYKDIRKNFITNHQKHLKSKIDGTAFITWFIENYPESIEIIKNQPDFQLKFL